MNKFQTRSHPTTSFNLRMLWFFQFVRYGANKTSTIEVTKALLKSKVNTRIATFHGSKFHHPIQFLSHLRLNYLCKFTILGEITDIIYTQYLQINNGIATLQGAHFRTAAVCNLAFWGSKILFSHITKT